MLIVHRNWHWICIGGRYYFSNLAYINAAAPRIVVSTLEPLDGLEKSGALARVA
jgi:hypothetical protein